MRLVDRGHVRAERIRVLPPAYPAAALLAAWLLQRWAPLPAVPAAVRLGGGLLAAAGVWLAVAAVREQSRHQTDPNPWSATTALVTSGPYAWGRNPIYLADLGLQAGIGLAAGWWWAVALLPPTWACLRFLVIRKEERFLAAAFGIAYAEYLARTRRWAGRRP